MLRKVRKVLNKDALLSIYFTSANTKCFRSSLRERSRDSAVASVQAWIWIGLDGFSFTSRKYLGIYRFEMAFRRFIRFHSLPSLQPAG